MNLRRTLLTAGRVLAQLRGDHRTIALMLRRAVRPHRTAGLDLRRAPRCSTGPGRSLLGVFPFIAMFLVTSVAMLRERTGGRWSGC